MCPMSKSTPLGILALLAIFHIWHRKYFTELMVLEDIVYLYVLLLWVSREHRYRVHRNTILLPRLANGKISLSPFPPLRGGQGGGVYIFICTLGDI